MAVFTYDSPLPFVIRMFVISVCVTPLANVCNGIRIWAHAISFFVPRPHDIAHPGSGSAQSLLRICSLAQLFSP